MTLAALQSPPAMPAVAHSTSDIDLALSLLGMSRKPITDAIMSAEALVSNVIPGLHPRYFAGVIAWGETTRFLRESMTSMQIVWAEESKNALPASVVQDGGLSAMQSLLNLPYGPFEDAGYQVVVAGGDPRTGIIGSKPPSCANLKGHLMVQAVNANNGQMPIFRIGNTTTKQNPQGKLDLGEDEIIIDNPDGSDNISTWILLVRFGLDGIYAELSKPLAITRAGKINKWSNRIVFGRIGSLSGVSLPMGAIGPSAEFDFGMSENLDENALEGT